MNSWAGALLPLAIVFIGLGGMSVFLWLHWKVKGPLVYRVYQHCSNFLVGAVLALGILVCIIGFFWDIGVI